MLKCIIISLVLLVIFDWYYVNIQKLINKKQIDHKYGVSDDNFKQYLTDHGKNYTNEQIRTRKEIYRKNYLLVQQNSEGG